MVTHVTNLEGIRTLVKQIVDEPKTTFVVEFYQKDCTPCKMLKRPFAELAKKTALNVVFVSVDIHVGRSTPHSNNEDFGGELGEVSDVVSLWLAASQKRVASTPTVNVYCGGGLRVGKEFTLEGYNEIQLERLVKLAEALRFPTSPHSSNDPID